jgi:hypothetical protein
MSDVLFFAMRVTGKTLPPRVVMDLLHVFAQHVELSTAKAYEIMPALLAIAPGPARQVASARFCPTEISRRKGKVGNYQDEMRLWTMCPHLL